MKIETSQTGKSKRFDGFTLSELLVVLAIVALFTSFAPTLYKNFVPAGQLAQAKRQLANDLKSARHHAISNRTTVAFEIAPSGQSYRSEEVELSRSLSGSLSLQYHANTQLAGDAEFAFYPDGGSTGGLFELTTGARKAFVTVNWLTGDVDAE